MKRPPSIAKGRVVCGPPSRSVLCRAGRQAFRSETQDGRMVWSWDKSEPSPDQGNGNSHRETQGTAKRRKACDTSCKNMFDLECGRLRFSSEQRLPSRPWPVQPEIV